ncbi:MAG: hypothetical protein U0232_07970 [Thermomicrobiales bacterium]
MQRRDLSVGKSCTVLVGFTPVATGHHNATSSSPTMRRAVSG